MFYRTLVCILLLGVYICNAEEESTSNYQNALNNLISRLGSHNQSSDNLVFMPPTFSVDIVSLLRWAVENTQDQGRNAVAGSTRSGKGPTLPPNNDFYYQRSLLELVEFGGKSYFISRNQKMIWVDAMKFCRSFDMDLVSVETAEEDDFIVKHLEKVGLKGQYVWMSGNKIGRATMIWINGEQIIYQNWQTGEPNVPASEHCMMFHVSKWYDYGCQNEAYFVCEQR